MIIKLGLFLQNWHPALHLINLKQTAQPIHSIFCFMLMSMPLCLKDRFINALLAQFWCARPLLYRLWWRFLYTFFFFCYWPLPVGIKHHRPYKINPFSAHDSPPKWCGCSPGPVHNVVMTHRSKVAWPVPQLRGKIAIARCIVCVRRRGQQWPVYTEYIDVGFAWRENFHPTMIQKALKVHCICFQQFLDNQFTCLILFFPKSVKWYFKHKYSK